MKRLTDPVLKSYLSTPPSGLVTLPDGAIPGLSVRVGTGGTVNWSFLIRVKGEGGAKPSGRLLLGPKLRLNLGHYPEVSISAARAKAAQLLDLAKRGVHPRETLGPASAGAGLTVESLSREFLKHHVHSRELDSARKYELALSTHINPRIGRQLAERLTREQVREVMDGVRVKRKRGEGKRGGPIGGVEAARTSMGVLRHMYAWAIEEGKLKRQDNPASKIDKNLPKKRQREVVLSLKEARLVWQAAESIGYPFGTHVQLMLLTGCRTSEWASARSQWIDQDQALMVIPASEYKSDHVHVVPLVSQAPRDHQGHSETACGRVSVVEYSRTRAHSGRGQVPSNSSPRGDSGNYRRKVL